METILLSLLILWVLGWAGYCVFGIAGVDLGLSLASMTPFLAGLLALVGLYLAWQALRYFLHLHAYSPGDHVVYLMQKYSRSPGRRAEQIFPAKTGDGYNYLVRKPWTVLEELDDGRLRVLTPGGKTHVINKDDPRLHKAGPVETLMLRLRWHKEFPDYPLNA